MLKFGFLTQYDLLPLIFSPFLFSLLQQTIDGTAKATDAPLRSCFKSLMDSFPISKGDDFQIPFCDSLIETDCLKIKLIYYKNGSFANLSGLCKNKTGSSPRCLFNAWMIQRSMLKMFNKQIKFPLNGVKDKDWIENETKNNQSQKKNFGKAFRNPRELLLKTNWKIARNSGSLEAKYLKKKK